MKGRNPHVVYLSRQAVDIFIALRTCAAGSKFILPSRYDADRCMSKATLNRGPPRQNTCRSNTIDEPGAMMRKRIGKIRTSIQGPRGCAVAAAGERGFGRRCT